MQKHPTNQNSDVSLRRPWLGIALLSASWLFGLSYYHDAQWFFWGMLVALGTLLLAGIPTRRPAVLESIAALLMLVPVIWLAPWPYRAAPLLILTGLVLGILPIPRRWPGILASGAVAAGVILVGQSLAIHGYEYITARSHELPWPLAKLILVVARCAGLEVALDGTDLVLHSLRTSYHLGATWELLLDPPTLSFVIGGIVLLCLLQRSGRAAGKRAPRLGRSIAVLVAAIFVWLLLRAALLITVFMHRALRTEYEEPLMLMNQFWNPWVAVVLLAGPVLLALCLIKVPQDETRPSQIQQSMGLAGRLAVVCLVALGVFILCSGLFVDPPGSRKAGRILVDEHHSTWERTDRPFDVNWYGHESGYNYACIYDYCSRFYEMARLNTSIDAAALNNCDVLVVKTPTSRYSSREITAIEQFVQDGGGLLLVGEHTNVFNIGVYLNDIAASFGFRFRDDCLFDIDTVFDQLYQPPFVPHPIVQNMPPLNFAVSCSIAPQRSIGRAVMRSTGLRSLPADYHASNFYPQVEDRSETRYGAFVQMWSVRHGAGRVLAFTDSTIFSNFSAFEPGKAELMLGMLEWLNHRNSLFDLRLLLVSLGILSLVGGLVLARGRRGACVVMLAAGMLAWATAGAAARVVHHRTMPLPKPSRPMVQVVIDRTVCNAPLSKSGFISGSNEGFGIFERWILRLGYFTSRRQDSDALAGDLVVFMHPNQTVTSQFRSALVNYVSSGGKVLVIDSPANAGSTANSLLYPFDVAIQHDSQHNGLLTGLQDWPAIKIESACEVKGGRAIMRVQNVPVAATVPHGKGTVTAIGFGSRFTDANMGVTGDTVPDETMRQVYDLQFRLLRAIVSGSW